MIAKLVQLERKSVLTAVTPARGVRLMDVRPLQPSRKAAFTSFKCVRELRSIEVRLVHPWRKHQPVSETFHTGDGMTIDVRPEHSLIKLVPTFTTSDNGLRSTSFKPVHP